MSVWLSGCLVLQDGGLVRVNTTESGILDLSWHNDGSRIAAAVGNTAVVLDTTR